MSDVSPPSVYKDFLLQITREMWSRLLLCMFQTFCLWLPVHSCIHWCVHACVFLRYMHVWVQSVAKVLSYSELPMCTSPIITEKLQFNQRCARTMEPALTRSNTIPDLKCSLETWWRPIALTLFVSTADSSLMSKTWLAELALSCKWAKWLTAFKQANYPG